MNRQSAGLQKAVLEQIRCSRQIQRQIAKEVETAMSTGKTSTKITVSVPASASSKSRRRSLGSLSLQDSRQKPKDKRRFVLKGVNCKRKTK